MKFINKQHNMTVDNSFQMISIDSLFTMLSYNLYSYNFKYFEK